MIDINRGFDAKDRFNASFLAGFIKLKSAIHVILIR